MFLLAGIQMILEVGLQVTGNVWDYPLGLSSPDPTGPGWYRAIAPVAASIVGRSLSLEDQTRRWAEGPQVSIQKLLSIYPV